jgi:hypothetical protein
MERQSRMKLVQPERWIGTDEVHAVAAIGERLRQFGRNDAAPAYRRVTQNAYIHEPLP